MEAPLPINIKDEIKRLDAEITRYENAIELLKLQKKQFQRQCEHPNKYSYSAQGDMGVHCPDCGWDI